VASASLAYWLAIARKEAPKIMAKNIAYMTSQLMDNFYEVFEVLIEKCCF